MKTGVKGVVSIYPVREAFRMSRLAQYVGVSQHRCVCMCDYVVHLAHAYLLGMPLQQRQSTKALITTMKGQNTRVGVSGSVVVVP